MSDFTEIRGPHGLFRIATAGGKPEFEIAHQYQDEAHHFFFYSDMVEKPGPGKKYDIVVHTLMWQPFREPISSLGPDEKKILDNIRLFIKTRSLYFPEQPQVVPCNMEEVKFSWKPRSF